MKIGAPKLPQAPAVQTSTPVSNPGKAAEAKVALRSWSSLPAVSAPAPGSAEVIQYLELLAPGMEALKLLGPDEVEAKIDRLQQMGVRVEEIGRSQEGRPLRALRVGEGPLHLAVMAYAHPDEPVGCSTALHLAERLHSDPALAGLREQVTVDLLPMANPDGAARNQGWFSSWPDIQTYLRQVRRDSPARDVEFGFPAEHGDPVRPENKAIAGWFDRMGKLDHYVSLHSMFLGGGALYLVTADDPSKHSGRLRFLLEQATEQGLPLHDKDRFGQKGFFRICPGLMTAPTAEGMQEFFSRGESKDVARHFTLNSMQYVQRHNACPLALVTEIPLCFDRRLGSMEPLPHSRVEEERRLAAGLESCLDEAAGWLARLREADPASPSVEAFSKALISGRAAASATLGDLERYGDARATVGNALETDLNLRRRRAALLGMALEAGKPLAATGPLCDELEAEMSAELKAIEREFPLQHPTIAGQVHAQLATILAALIPTADAAVGTPPEESSHVG